jgi:hypothetical protein
MRSRAYSKPNEWSKVSTTFEASSRLGNDPTTLPVSMSHSS